MGKFTGIIAAKDYTLIADFIAAEEADFCWEARRSERWIGCWEGVEAQDIDLDRVAIIGCLEAQWFVATLLVDGDGSAHALLFRRNYADEMAAREAFDALC